MCTLLCLSNSGIMRLNSTGGMDVVCVCVIQGKQTSCDRFVSYDYKQIHHLTINNFCRRYSDLYTALKGYRKSSPCARHASIRSNWVWAPLILNLVIRWTWAASFRTQRRHPQQISLRTWLTEYKALQAPRNVWYLWRKVSCPCRESKHDCQLSNLQSCRCNKLCNH